MLSTERLLLRPVHVEDMDLLWPGLSDPDISRYMAWQTHTDKGQTRAFVEAEMARLAEDRGVTWAIFAGDAFRGIVSLIALIRSYRALTFNKAELAYWLLPEYQGQGIMTEACRCAMRFGFEQLGLHKIVVSHFAPNLASEKLIKRLGFRYIGEQVDEFWKDGVWYSHRLYELLDRDAQHDPRVVPRG